MTTDRPPLLRPFGSALYFAAVAAVSGLAAVVPLETAGEQLGLVPVIMAAIGGFMGLGVGTLAEIRAWTAPLFSWSLNITAILLAGLAYVSNRPILHTP